MGGLTVAQINILIKVRDEARIAMGKIGTAATKMAKVVKVAALAAGVALAAFVAHGIRSFLKFDQAMNQSLAIMGDVSDAMREDMSKAAREMAKVTTFSATQVAESYFFLASAGKSAEQSLALLPAVAEFAQAGMFDMATATDLLTDAQSALGLTAADTTQDLENLVRVSDVLVKANTLANATVQQFATSLTTEAGAALKSFNIDVEEGVAVLAAFADQGVKGEKAGTGLSRILRLMTSNAVSSAEAYERLNVQVFDSQGNINNLADIIGDLEGALSGMSDEQRVAALEALGFQARVQGVILPLLGSADAIRDYEAALRDAGGTTKEISDKQLESFAAQIGLLQSRLTDLAMTIAEALMPALKAINKAMLEAMPAIEAFVKDGIERAGKAFDNFKSKVQPAIDLIAKFVDHKDAMIIMGVLLAAVAAGFVAIAVAATAAFVAENLALLGIPALIALVVAGVVILSRHWEGFGDAMENVAEVAGNALQFILAAANLYLFPMIEAARVAIAIFQGDWGKAWGIIQAIPGRAMQAVLDVFGKGMDLLNSLAGAGLDTLHGIFGDAFTAIGNKVIGIFESMVNGVISGLNDIGAAINEVLSAADAIPFAAVDFRFSKIGSIALPQLDFGGAGRSAGEAWWKGAAEAIGDGKFNREIVRVYSDASDDIEDVFGPNGDIPDAAGAGAAGAAAAIEKVLTDRERWEAAGRSLADALASGLRGGTITITDAVSSMFTFMDALPAKFSDIAATVGSVIGAFEAAQQAAQALFDTIVERGEVTFSDLAEAARLGAFDMAQDFLDEMEGRSSDIGAAIFEHAQEEAAKAAKESADEFVDAFASAVSDIEGMFAGISGTISGLVGGPSVESAAENAALTRLRLDALLLEQDVLQEQGQALEVIANLEAQIAFIRSQGAVEVDLITGALEAQQILLDGINVQIEAVRAEFEPQIKLLQRPLDTARAKLADVKADARDAIAESAASLRATKKDAREAISVINASLRVTRKETSAMISAANAEASEARRTTGKVIAELERELEKLIADFAFALPSQTRSIRDILADIDKAGSLRRPGLQRELALAKKVNQERQDQIKGELDVLRPELAAIEEAAATLIEAAELQLTLAEAAAKVEIAAIEDRVEVAEAAAKALRDMWDEIVAGAQTQVDGLKDQQDDLKEQMRLQLDVLEAQKDFAERDLATLQRMLDDYTASIEAQEAAIADEIAVLEDLIKAVEDHQSAAAKDLKAIRAEIAALELLAKIRRLERDMVAAQALAQNERLKTDAEVLKAIYNEAAAFQELAGAMDILNDGVLDVRDALVLAQLGFTDLADIILNILAGIQAVPQTKGGVPWLASFGDGGIVPGPIGQPQLIVAHGGEGVLTQEDLKALAGGRGPVTVNVYPRGINIYSNNPRETLGEMGASWATEALNG